VSAEQLEQRLRRLATIVVVLAVAAAVFGMLPNGLEVRHLSFKRETITYDGTIRAGGWSLVGWALFQVLLARTLRREPTRSAARLWIGISIAVDIAAAIAWLIENFTLADETLRWPAHLTGVCVGSVCVLVFVGLPIVLLTTRKAQPAVVPTAEARDSSS
jgi:hypothetical protein